MASNLNYFIVHMMVSTVFLLFRATLAAVD